MTQTNLHLIDAFPTASAWQEEWTIWFFLSPFLLLFTGHPIAYQETSLYCQSLVDDQHLCLLPEVYLKKKSEQSVPHEATLAHMKVNPVVLGIFHGSSMAEIIFSHLTFSPSSQQKPGVRFLRNETLRYFLNRGRISDTYNSLPWWNPSAIIKKSLSLLTHIISVTTVWLSLDYLRNNRYMSYVAANDTGKAGKSLSHSGLSCTFILHAHIP